MPDAKICPVCEHHRDKLVSLSSINERFHGITISHDGKYVEKICYPCRKKAEKELKKKGSAKLSGRGFEILIFGYLNYLNEIKRYLRLSKNFFDQAVMFIKDQYLALETKIPNNDKMKFFVAGIIMLFQEKGMHDEEIKLKNFMKTNYSNVSLTDLDTALLQIKKWCLDRGDYKPFG